MSISLSRNHFLVSSSRAFFALTRGPISVKDLEISFEEFKHFERKPDHIPALFSSDFQMVSLTKRTSQEVEKRGRVVIGIGGIQWTYLGGSPAKKGDRDVSAHACG